MTTLTLELTDQLREKIDEVRGDTPLNEYVLSVLEEQAYTSLDDITPGLSAAEHIRLADLAEQPGQSMTADEVITKVKAHFPDLWPEEAVK